MKTLQCPHCGEYQRELPYTDDCTYCEHDLYEEETFEDTLKENQMVLEEEYTLVGSNIMFKLTEKGFRYRKYGQKDWQKFERMEIVMDVYVESMDGSSLLASFETFQEAKQFVKEWIGANGYWIGNLKAVSPYGDRVSIIPRTGTETLKKNSL